MKFDLYSQLFEPDRLYIPEERLQKLWVQSLWKKPLKTLNGESIHVLSPGIHNRHEGPDFMDALIFIGPTMEEGDVEIHYSNRDWYRHGHHKDPAYDRVILHVIFDRVDHEQWVVNRKSERIPVCLGDYSVLEMTPDQTVCRPKKMDPEDFFEILKACGEKRFTLKVDYIRRQSARFRGDLLAWWGLFQSCGFKANRSPFNRLFLAFPWAKYFSGDLKKREIPALINYLAGFSGNQAGNFFPEISAPKDLRWVRMGVRPPARPENRLKWLSAFLIKYYKKSLTGHLTNALSLQNFTRRFWKDFLSSGCTECKEPGENQAVEIAMNALMPVIAALEEPAGPGKLPFRDEIHQISVSEYALSRKFYARHGIYVHPLRRKWINQQGILYIHERFCTMDLADVCPLCKEEKNS